MPSSVPSEPVNASVSVVSNRKEATSSSNNISCSSHTNQIVNASPTLPSSTINVNQMTSSFSAAMLGTAQIRLMTPSSSHPLRALCDTGSQLNLITKDCVQRCGLRYEKHQIAISGAGSDSIIRSCGYIETMLCHRQRNQPAIPVRFIVVSRISNRLPQAKFEHKFGADLEEKDLADPLYNVPGQIDALLGAGIWATIVDNGIIRKLTNTLSLLAQNTSLGWVIFGHVYDHFSNKPAALHIREADRFDEILQRFWEIESVPSQHTRTSDEDLVEMNFQETHYRDASGRYIVTIPLRKNASPLGVSRNIALKRYYALEHRLARNPDLRTTYNAFMLDYLQAGHMIEASPPPERPSESYYIPYHIINKKKFRVVFDASCSSSTGVSFNNMQLPGEKLQGDLGDILLRFRLHQFGITADIVKMFRQVNVNESQWNYQRVLWRPSIDYPVKEYFLTTVTWGMTSAGFNAVRALRQCAVDEASDYPIASEAVLNDFYIDDFLSGRNDYQSLSQLRHQTISLLQRGGFTLAKWATNNNQLANELNFDSSSEIPLQSETGILGMVWLPSTDQFKLKISIHDLDQCTRLTKRDIISRISQVYDPSNLFGPVIIKGKILIQDLWRIEDLQWDDQVPIDMISRWKDFHANIMQLSSHSIPRWVGFDPTGNMQWHIFCDASEAAYGAAVYLRTQNSNNEITSRLLTSKSKVAPIQKSTTPRLELMAAHLGTKLAAHVISACKLVNVPVFFWSDSTIVVHWLKKDPNQLKQFVSNRVSSIQRTTATLKGSWQHVAGSDNPADLISRGLSSKDLCSSTLWWTGPKWLQLSQTEWPTPAVSILSSSELRAEIDETKPAFIGVIKLNLSNCLWGRGPNHTQIPLVERQSTLNSILRITAYVMRFVRNIRTKIAQHKAQASQTQINTRHRHRRSRRSSRQPYARASRNSTPFCEYKRPGPIDISTPTPDERDNALMYWIGIAQRCYYSQEVRSCEKGIQLPPNSPLRHFAPFLDPNGLLRVGGRLENASIPYHQKHQLFVPRESSIGRLIVRNAHYITLHGGLSVNKAFLRQRFWFPRIGMAIRHFTNSCPTCIRHRKITGEQLMGQLPSVRVTAAEPFAHVGVDFAGPFKLRKTAGKILPLRQAAHIPYREPPTTKGWIVVYVCLATRAIHLDVTNGLTVEDFLETFSRMTSRRGLCREIWSDNGSTFIGSNNEMKRVLQEWDNKVPSAQLASLGTTWNFITPSAPFQGGIWEAGVKSAKTHLYRIVGARILTAGQLYTILTQIEAVLNSRPLWPQSDDPLDLAPITPAHLVIGRSTLQRPLSEDLSNTADNRLTMWGLQQKMQQVYWKRWKEEYLNIMQKRVKWYKARKNLKPGDMVVIKSENVPPTAWPLGRVTSIKRGQDGYVRSATVKTQFSLLDRPIQKLCVLPSATQLSTHS